MLAIGLALVASFCFAAAMILINRGVLVLDYFRGLLTNLGVNALFLWFYLFCVGNRHEILVPANLILFWSGFSCRAWRGFSYSKECSDSAPRSRHVSRIARRCLRPCSQCFF